MYMMNQQELSLLKLLTIEISDTIACQTSNNIWAVASLALPPNVRSTQSSLLISAGLNTTTLNQYYLFTFALTTSTTRAISICCPCIFPKDQQ